MKKLAATLFAFVLAVAVGAPIVSAQDNMSQGTMGSQPNKAEIAAKLEKMSAALQLTPAQKKQITPILMQEAPKLQALKADTSLGPRRRRCSYARSVKLPTRRQTAAHPDPGAKPEVAGHACPGAPADDAEDGKPLSWILHQGKRCPWSIILRFHGPEAYPWACDAPMTHPLG